MRAAMLSLCAGLLCGGAYAGCGGSDGDGPAPTYTLDEAALMDPVACAECHPDHYREWSGSMHAYASLDPVFLAMNALGQEETGGELGDFCVQCHAPMALRLGLTTDGLNLDEVPAYAQGVTCFFCHTADAVMGTHNNPIALAGDGVMRGAYADPVPNEAHASAYSPLLDRERIESADLCGSCHDIVTPQGVHLERTYEEWKGSLFAHETPGEQQTCGNCHMPARDDVAADADGVFLRRVHGHMMPGVDTALTPFPELEAQQAAVAKELDTAVAATLCVAETDGAPTLTVGLENMAAGHAWPSGAAQDRRAWVELIAYDGDDGVLFQSGAVADGQPLTDLEDPHLWRLGDRTFDADGHEAHMFWEVATVESELLPPPTEVSPAKPGFIDTHQFRIYTYDGPAPTRVTLRVRIRPLGLDLIDILVDRAGLDPTLRDAIITYTLGATQLTWTAAQGVDCIPVSLFQ